MKKRYRVYFNRGEDAPQIWSLDEGGPATEINVQNIVIGPNATAVTASDPTQEDPNQPKAWFEVRGKLMIQRGVAFFE